MEQTILRDVKKGELKEEEIVEEEALARVDIWKYVLGFTEMAMVKCAIDLGIADMLHKNGGSMSLSELSSSLNCPPSTLYRLMRFLTCRKIFSQTQTSHDTIVYAQTPLSRRLSSHEEKNLAALILLESTPVMLAPWLELSNRIKGKNASPFAAANGEDVWSYASNDLAHSKLINDAMACDARVVVPQIIKECPRLFDGVFSVVDVGGGDGTTSSILVKGFPWIRAINFDVPHVVSPNVVFNNEQLQHVGGNMFESIPKADVAFMKWVLHDWSDEECIQILKRCKEAIPKDDGKVIIIEAIIDDGTKDEFEDARLMLDMAMWAHTTNGKERTLKEWSYLLKEAGFCQYNVKHIQAVQSVIEAFLDLLYCTPFRCCSSLQQFSINQGTCHSFDGLLPPFKYISALA